MQRSSFSEGTFFAKRALKKTFLYFEAVNVLLPWVGMVGPGGGGS